MLQVRGHSHLLPESPQIRTTCQTKCYTSPKFSLFRIQKKYLSTLQIQSQSQFRYWNTCQGLNCLQKRGYIISWQTMTRGCSETLMLKWSNWEYSNQLETICIWRIQKLRALKSDNIVGNFFNFLQGWAHNFFTKYKDYKLALKGYSMQNYFQQPNT